MHVPGVLAAGHHLAPVRVVDEEVATALGQGGGVAAEVGHDQLLGVVLRAHDDRVALGHQGPQYLVAAPVGEGGGLGADDDGAAELTDDSRQRFDPVDEPAAEGSRQPVELVDDPHQAGQCPAGHELAGRLLTRRIGHRDRVAVVVLGVAAHDLAGGAEVRLQRLELLERPVGALPEVVGDLLEQWGTAAVLVAVGEHDRPLAGAPVGHGELGQEHGLPRAGAAGDHAVLRAGAVPGLPVGAAGAVGVAAEPDPAVVVLRAVVVHPARQRVAGDDREQGAVLAAAAVLKPVDDDVVGVEAQAQGDVLGEAGESRGADVAQRVELHDPPVAVRQVDAVGAED